MKTRRHCLGTLFAAALCWLSPPVGAQPLPEVSVGRIERLADFPSRHVQARHVDVWLPPGYSASVPHAVLYMHDGQMLFDAKTTWNRQAWDAHLTVARLIEEKRIPPTLIVGVWNAGTLRFAEYFPQAFLAHLPDPARGRVLTEGIQGQARSQAYLRFLVEELKPEIDRRFATRPGRESTAILGSSMGGLISMHAANEYPQIFGAAAGLSTHWMGGREPNAALPLAAFRYLHERLRAPDGQRLYMDHGTTELDTHYGIFQRFIDEIYRERGYREGASFTSRVFEGTGHNERDWARRLALPVEFLLKGR
jgi:enterochelin esterase-like enzyme